MKVLVVGSGGREHALCWAVKQSPLLTALYAAPGNPGIASLATCLPVAADDVVGLVDTAQEHGIDFVIVGPEGALVKGLVDALAEKNIKAFGPNKNAAQIEGSKGFMKDLCAKAGVPTARYARFTTIEKAKAHVQHYVQEHGAPIVIKADGLAAGKGVTVAMNLDDALKAIDAAMRDKAFGPAGTELVIEEYMEGEEASFFALVDGTNAIPFTHAQDHKRAFDGDKGPNTGGMGAYSPAPMITPALQHTIMERIILPTAQAMVDNGTPFRGVLFAGLMITREGPRLIEYNARFGDPETQAMLPRLKSDLLEALYETACGNLKAVELKWHDKTALCVVMAAVGYPGTFMKGTIIHGLDKAAHVHGAHVFHAGTMKGEGDAIIANGGRVLGITGLGTHVKDAQKKAYEAVDKLDWPQGFCRRDIGARAAG